MRQRAAWQSVSLIVIFLFTSELRARAYTDPGTGLLLWQGLAATILGAAFYFRKLLFALFGRKQHKEEQASGE